MLKDINEREGKHHSSVTLKGLSRSRGHTTTHRVPSAVLVTSTGGSVQGTWYPLWVWASKLNIFLLFSWPMAKIRPQSLKSPIQGSLGNTHSHHLDLYPKSNGLLLFSGRSWRSKKVYITFRMQDVAPLNSSITAPSCPSSAWKPHLHSLLMLLAHPPRK